MMNNEYILEVKGLKKHFGHGKDIVKAVDGVSFSIKKGEVLGLVGESGCGKSTTGRTIIDLYKCTEGTVIFNGKNVHTQVGAEKKEFNRRMQMIFQDPYSSLNPRMTVMDIVAHGIDIHGLAKGKERQERVFKLLETVGLNKEHANRFPHEFSGGQRQRIGIARALAVEPDFIIADEPISALDVSIQAQVVNLLKELQIKHNMTYLFIAHDLSMVKHISDRVGVMYLGHMMEIAPSIDFYKNPLHPYTKALLSAIPIPDPKIEQTRKRIILEGDVPSPINPPMGCPFHTRCAMSMTHCGEIRPILKEIGKNHMVACHLY